VTVTDVELPETDPGAQHPQDPEDISPPEVSSEEPEDGFEQQRNELDALQAESNTTSSFDPDAPLKLLDGTLIAVKPLKMRELLKLLRIVTRGGAMLLPTLRFNGITTDDFAQQFVAVILFAVPEAEIPTAEFIQSIVEPGDLRADTKENSKYNEQQRELLLEKLENPDLEDLVTIVEAVVHNEKDDLQSLGKRLSQVFNLARKSGQLGSVDSAPTS
jgi:hypothetical protein